MPLIGGDVSAHAFDAQYIAVVFIGSLVAEISERNNGFHVLERECSASVELRV